LDLQLPMQSVATDVVGWNLDQGVIML